jgi:hypothetical protein
LPAFVYSEKYGCEPQPTKALPFGRSCMLPVKATSKLEPWRY